MTKQPSILVDTQNFDEQLPVAVGVQETPLWVVSSFGIGLGFLGLLVAGNELGHEVSLQPGEASNRPSTEFIEP